MAIKQDILDEIHTLASEYLGHQCQLPCRSWSVTRLEGRLISYRKMVELNNRANEIKSRHSEYLWDAAVLFPENSEHALVNDIVLWSGLKREANEIWLSA